MLDVIGAGASATSREDWHEIWCNSDEFTKVQGQIQEIHAKGRSEPAVGTTLHSEYATSWFHQVVQLVKRDASDHFRDPSYMMAKMALNIVSGLFLGFSFFKSKDTQQGTQNKLFVRRFVGSVFPTANVLSVVYLHVHHYQCSSSESAPDSVPQYAFDLRDSRAPKSHVQLDCAGDFTNPRRGALEYHWVIAILLLLVLDVWVH